MICAAVLLLALWTVPASAQPQGSEEMVMQDIRKALKTWDDAQRDRKELPQTQKRDLQAWYDELVRIERAESDARISFDMILWDGAKLYGVAPRGLSIYEGAEAKQGPMAAQDGKPGKVMIWQPQVITEQDRDLIIEFEGSDGKQHYGILTKKHLKEDAGNTLPNGKSTINLKTLRKCVTDGNLGELAYALDHEGFHFWDKTTRAEVSKAKSEVDSYEYSLHRSDKYPGGGWKTFLKDKSDEWQALVTAGDTQSVYPTPEQELILKDLYLDQQKELQSIRAEKDRLKISVEVGRNLRLVSNLAQKACDGGINAEEVTWYYPPPEEYRGAAPDESLSGCADGVSRDILEQMKQGGYPNSAWISYHAKNHRTQAQWNKIRKEAAACEFELVKSGASLTGIRETSGADPLYPYIYKNAGDFEAVTVSLLMTNACLLVTKYKHNMNEPGWDPICNVDGMAILNRRWNDPALRNFLYGTESSQDHDLAQARCMWELLDKLRPPVTEQSFRKALMNAHKEHQKDLKDLERNRRDIQRREKENRDIERRNKEMEERNERNRERKENGSKGGCIKRGIWYPQC